jgi:ABC-2 type transport system ATP-binding protein
MKMEEMIKVSNLCKDYRDFKLKNISFSLPKGYIMGFIGKNGAGKTTTIRSIIGSIDYEGECLVFGKDLRNNVSVKEKIGVVLDDIFYMSHLTAQEVEKQIKGFYSEWDGEKFRDYLVKFEIPYDKRIEKFSRGMQMKFMLSVALSHNAELLILDEPTSGLDPITREELLEILLEYISDGNKSVLFSTHITTDLERIADYITMISDGRLLYSGPKEDFIEKYVVIKGNQKEMLDDLLEKLIGTTMYENRFEALIECKYIQNLPKGIISEKASIDEILVFYAKEEENV